MYRCLLSVAMSIQFVAVGDCPALYNVFVYPVEFGFHRCLFGVASHCRVSYGGPCRTGLGTYDVAFAVNFYAYDYDTFLVFAGSGKRPEIVLPFNPQLCPLPVPPPV